MLGHDIGGHGIAVGFYHAGDEQQQRPERHIKPLQEIHAEAVPQAVLLGSEVGEGSVPAVCKVQVEPGVAQPHRTAHDDGEHCPGKDADHENRQHAAAAGGKQPGKPRGVAVGVLAHVGDDPA